MKDNIEQLLNRVEFGQTTETPKADYLDEDILFIESLERIPEVYESKLYANILCFCTKGNLEVDINATHYSVREGDTLVCPSGVTLSSILVSPDFKFTILALTDRIMRELLNMNLDVWNRAVYVRKEHVFRRNICNNEAIQHHKDMADHFLALLRNLMENRENPFRREMIHSLLTVALLGFCARLKEKEQDCEDTGKASTQAGSLFNRFMELLREEPMKHRPVYYYAERLYISPKHLTFVCNNVSGKSAAHFIQAAVVEDLIRMLKDFSLSVKEIAHRMGFENISFFGKYVKNHLGVSPNEYRRRLGKG